MQRGLRVLLALGCTMFFSVAPGNWSLIEDCGAADSQHTVNTRHTTIVLNNIEDMNTLNDSIDFAAKNSLASLFSSSDAQSVEGELVRKIDLLFEKVQAILDMRKEMKKVRVRVFSNSDQLHEAYEKIYKQKCSVRGWYLYEFDTVFLNVQDVHAGMLAHELGHAVIDHFFAVRPPRSTAEILAVYVDMHLNEEVTKY